MPKDLLKWESIRKKGMLKFVLLYGVLLWGMLSGLLYALIMSFVLPKIFGGNFGASLSVMLPVSLGLFGNWRRVLGDGSMGDQSSTLEKIQRKPRSIKA